MEAASRAAGVARLADLLDACVNTYDRIQKFRQHDLLSQRLVARLNSHKFFLQRWAQAHGVVADHTEGRHSTRLDDDQTQICVKDTLISIDKLLQSTSRKLTGQYIIHPSPSGETKSLGLTAFRRRSGFSIGGEGRLDKDVEDIEKLVASLFELVPTGRSIDKDVSQFEISNKVLVRAWLNADDMTSYYEHSKTCRIPETCKWIFDTEEFQRFINIDPNRPQCKILWLHAEPGPIKSLQAAYLINEIRQQTSSKVLFHFCSAVEPQRRKHISVLQSVLTQMLDDDDALQIAHDIMSTAETACADDDELWTTLKFLLTNSTSKAYTIVIDGFDEHPVLENDVHGKLSISRGKFLSDLVELISTSSSRLLFVSKDEEDLREPFYLQSYPAEVVKVQKYAVSHVDTTDDVETVTDHFVRPDLGERPLDIREDVAASVASRSRGIFPGTKLQEGQLFTTNNASQLRQDIDGLPRGLRGIYEQEWERIWNQRPRGQKRTFEILRWVTFAMRPLTPLELIEALAIDLFHANKDLCLEELPDCVIDGDYVRTEILQPCGVFLQLRRASKDTDPSKDTLELSHLSAETFLASQFADEAETNTLAIACLQYLAHGAAFKPLHLADSRLGDHPFANYASGHWMMHLDSKYRGPSYHYALDLAFMLLEPSNPNFVRWRAAFEDQMDPSKDAEHTEIPGTSSYYAAHFGLEPVLARLHAQHPEDLDTFGGLYGFPLQAACVRGHISSALYIIRAGTDVNQNGGYLGSALNAAVVRDDSRLVSILLRRGARVSSKGLLGRDALIFAAGFGRIALIDQLIRAGADINSTDCHGSIAVMYAISHGEVGAVRHMLDLGADLHHQNGTGETAWHAALGIDDIDTLREICTILKSHGVLDEPNFAKAHNARSLAVLQDRLDILKCFVSQGLDVHEKVAHSGTLLHLAASVGGCETIKYLLDHGLEIDSLDDRNSSPFHAAVHHGQLEACKTLAALGADFRLRGSEGVTPLHRAASEGHHDIAEYLIHAGADVNSTLLDGTTALHTASGVGNFQIVRTLHMEGAKLDTVDTDGCSPLWSAVAGGHNDIAEYLVSNGVPVDVAQADGVTALLIAAQMGNLDAVKLLYSRGADLKRVDGHGAGLLHLSALCGHESIVSYGLNMGLGLNLRDQTAGMTPVHLAAIENHLSVVKLLHRAGADLSVRRTDGIGLLQVAAYDAGKEVTRYLLDECQLDVEDREGPGPSPLNLAARANNVGVVQVLIDAGARPDTHDKQGIRPLQEAALHGSLAVAELLLQHGALMRSEADEESPLAMAASAGQQDTVKFLLGSGSVLRATSGDVLEALVAAASEGCFGTFTYLLGLGVDLEKPSSSGETVLHCLARAGDLQGVRALIKAGANVNTARYDSRTALGSAVVRQRTDVARLLLQRGADTTVVCKLGSDEDSQPETVLQYARRSGMVEMVEVLIKGGATT